ncbi:MAG: hypothetical protein PVG70_16080 [Desulfobacterales bacterium]|jgi:hypothetical protein
MKFTPRLNPATKTSVIIRPTVSVLEIERNLYEPKFCILSSLPIIEEDHPLFFDDHTHITFCDGPLPAMLLSFRLSLDDMSDEVDPSGGQHLN